MNMETLQQESYKNLLNGNFIEINKDNQKERYLGVMHKQIRLGKYLWFKEYCFLDNTFQEYPFLEEKMQLSSMKISYNPMCDLFQIELYHFVRDGGYKEPWVKEVIGMSEGFSFEECLRKIEQQLLPKAQSKGDMVLVKVLHE